MKKIIHNISPLIGIFVFLCSTQVNASHILGHELTYTCVGTNQYKTQVILYIGIVAIVLMQHFL